jgi:nucleotide-binding universal stress UspA family protein
MSRPILVPLDGSPLDERALSYAAPLARIAGAPLHLVRAVPAVRPTLYSGAEALGLALAQQHAHRLDVQAALARTAARLRRQELVIHTHVRFGPPADVIVEASRDHGVGLLVLATRGRRGMQRWWEGSVADEAVRWAEVPVVVVRAGDTPTWPQRRPPRLLVALDGSTFAEAVLGPAGELAVLLGADVLLVRVVAPPSLLVKARAPQAAAGLVDEQLAAARAYLEGVAAGFHAAGPVATRVALGATPAVSLARIARAEQVDLVALATRGRAGLARLALGSVATAMLERSPVPLLVVGPTRPPVSAAGAAPVLAQCAGGKRVLPVTSTPGAERDAATAGAVAGGHCLDRKLTPHEVRASSDHLSEFQRLLRDQGIVSAWPRL